MSRTALASFLQRQWLHGGWLSGLLLPLAGLTWLAVAAKRTAYRRGWRRAWRAPVPVVIVGNLMVGGTGKTPVVMAVIRALRERGWHPGVVSRGYGVAVGPQPRVALGATARADEIGDEPALIAGATGAPVAVHPRRPLAAQALLRAAPQVDVIVADDGLQHLALARDVEIVVQDARGLGNGRLLPAGPLREPASRLAEADAVVVREEPNAPPARLPACPGVHATAMRLRPSAYVRLVDGRRLAPEAFRKECEDRTVSAAAGIGRPAHFFDTLRSQGLALAATLPLPDHHDFRASPFAGLPGDVIVITAKDAVKCRTLADPRLWVAEVEPAFSDPGFFDWLHERLAQARQARG